MSKKNKKQDLLIKKIYTTLSKIEIIMYNIKDLNEFNKMVKESIIPVVLKEKKDFEKIKENCEKSFIIEINGKHKKILYNIEEINKLTHFKYSYIDELFNLYSPCKYEKIGKEEYIDIVEKRKINLIDQCKSKIPVQCIFGGNGKIKIFCPVCKKEYLIYLKIDEKKIITSKQYNKKELNDESYIYKLGYSLKNSKEERMNALETALILGDWHSQKIIWYINDILIGRNGKRDNMMNAVQKWNEDLNDFIKILYEKYGIKPTK